MVFVAVMLTAVNIDMRQHRHVEADRSDAVNLQQNFSVLSTADSQHASAHGNLSEAMFCFAC